jgi:hypothetical protein
MMEGAALGARLFKYTDGQSESQSTPQEEERRQQCSRPFLTVFDDPGLDKTVVEALEEA